MPRASDQAEAVMLYDREKCRQRSRLAARRGFEACPLRLAGSAPPPAPEKASLISARGQMPTGEAALARINQLVLGDPLKPEQVLVRYLESGNSNFIPSRTMFLHASTLKNVARSADDGFAFMNSHRTGGLSSPAELPMGRTFAGRYESYALPGGQPFSRAVLGIYMLAGQRPNGANGPSTDELAAGIDAGTIFDVSLGIKGGRALCDVCGFDLTARDDEGRYLCLHVPGTTRRMSLDQKRSQKARGVPDGVATYSIHDGTAGEISAVFDGAVPGAGFRRALAASGAGLLGPAELSQLQAAYGHLIDDRHRGGVSRRYFDLGRGARVAHSTFGFEGKPMPRRISANGLLALLGLGSSEGDHDDDVIEIDDEGRRLSTGRLQPAQLAAAASAEPKPDPAVAQLQAQLAATNKALKDAEDARARERRDAQLAAIDRDVTAFVDGEKLAGRVNGEQAAKLGPALRQAAIDDLDHPVEGFSRLASLKAIQLAARPHGLTTERVAGGAKATTVLANDGAAAEYDPRKAAREQNDRHLATQGVKPTR